MGIGGINDYSGFLQNYRVPTIPTVSVEDVKKQDQQRIARENEPSGQLQSLSDVKVQQAPRKDAALEDISLTFNKQDDFGFIGKDSDIRSLDMENAISDMQKDSLLKQYQFFVGSNAGNTLVNDADGLVIPKF